jgi:hypothetical protein
LEKSQIDFLARCKELGFKDKSSVVRLSLDRLHQDILREKLEESADLYAELYVKDPAQQQLTEAALVEWPE